MTMQWWPSVQNSLGYGARRLGGNVSGMFSPQNLYDQLKAYYLSNGLYDQLQSEAFWLNEWHESMRPLRNPANRTVEFYVAKIWPGNLPEALPIETENEAIVEPIEQVWLWSNLSSMKQVIVRWAALYGDVFIHVVSNPERTRVYWQIVEPQYVTDFEVDHRGFIQEIRIDMPVVIDGKQMTHTEIWTKDVYRLWVHPFGEGADTERMGTPEVQELLSEYGINFVPFVHVKFRDVGEKRGIGCFTHVLDKIDEANRMATRLHQMLFRYNRPYLAVSANQLDPSGRPLPAPRMGAASGSADADAIEMRDDTLFQLPGVSQLHTMVPQIDYGSALSILQDHMRELEKDLPELAYYALREKGDLSGRAVRLLLSDAIDRAIEARGNLEAALVRADQMALTIGVYLGLFPSEIGTYEEGDFEHAFSEREVFPVTAMEKAETLQTLMNAGLPLVTAMRVAQFTDVEIDDAVAEKKKEEASAKATMAQALLRAEREFNAGGNAAQREETVPEEQQSTSSRNTGSGTQSKTNSETGMMEE